MSNWIWGLAFLVAYLVLTQWLLPNLAFLPEGANIAPSLGARPFREKTLRRTVTTIVQIEFRHTYSQSDRTSFNVLVIH